MALTPRLLAIGRYVTADEMIWVYRTVQFREALLSQRWADTLTGSHPGVTTTWLGALGINIQMLLRPEDRAIYEWITHLAWFAPDNIAAFRQMARFLTAGRLLIAAVNSAGVVAVFWLARTFYGRFPAYLAALLLALDPFVAGLSGIMHVDGLMTTFVTLALLAFLAAARPDKRLKRRLRYVAFSGLCTALALLTKSPAVVLLPILGLIWLWSAVKDNENGRWRRAVALGLAWGGTLVFILLALFPAAWSAPTLLASRVNSQVTRHVTSTLRPVFFLGQSIYDPGSAFYPVTLAFRLSPIVFSGLILAILLIVSRRWQPWREKTRLSTAMLALWPVLFIAVITLATKKFDRYALPVIPALTLLAAVAWTRFMQRWRWPVRWGWLLLAGLQAIYLLAFTPYLLTAYNPLLGGPQVAVNAVPVGWGEGISAAGEWLADRPGSAEKTAVAGVAPALAPFYPGQTLYSTPENRRGADYVIETVSGRQMADEEEVERMADLSLVHTVHFNGLDQAWIYEQTSAPTATTPLNLLAQSLSFDQRIQLLANGTAVVAPEPGKREVHYSARWRAMSTEEDGRFTVQLTLVDEAGLAWSQTETDLVNEVYFYPEHWQPEETPTLRYVLPLPPGTPPGTYRVEVSLFDSGTGAQLPVWGANGRFQGVVHRAGAITVPPPETPPAVSDLVIPAPLTTSWLDDDLQLLGAGALPESVLNGSRMQVDLYWQAQASLPPDLQLLWTIGESEQLTSLSRYPSAAWRAGEVIQEKYTLSAPVDLAAGEQPVAVQVVGGAETAATLGAVTVIETDRQFTLPADVPTPLNVQFGSLAALRGAALAVEQVPVGGTVSLTLYWQALAQPERIYAAFVHLVAPDGGIVAQADRWPGGLPTNTWVAGQVIEDLYTIDLPPDAPPGAYRIGVGLYTPEDGVRLPAAASAVQVTDDNRVYLPMPLTVEATGE